MRPDQAPFNEFSYFAELNTGRYEAPAGGTGAGRYRIVEKARLGAGPTHERVPLRFQAGDDFEYWRECEVRRDSEWQTMSPPNRQ